MPSAAGLPTWTGAPCTAGYLAVTETAAGTRAPGTGRMDTTRGPLKIPGHAALVAGDEHRDVAALLDVTHGHARRGERPLEREAAADEERDQVLAPVRGDVRGLGDALPVLPDAVGGQVGPQVGAGSQGAGRDSRLGDIEDRARFRVPLREQHEVEGDVTRQHDQVGLGVARGPCSGRGYEPAPEALPCLIGRDGDHPHHSRRAGPRGPDERLDHGDDRVDVGVYVELRVPRLLQHQALEDRGADPRGALRIDPGRQAAVLLAARGAAPAMIATGSSRPPRTISMTRSSRRASPQTWTVTRRHRCSAGSAEPAQRDASEAAQRVAGTSRGRCSPWRGRWPPRPRGARRRSPRRCPPWPGSTGRSRRRSGPVSATMSCIVVRWKPSRAKHATAASMICRRRDCQVARRPPGASQRPLDSATW